MQNYNQPNGQQPTQAQDNESTQLVGKPATPAQPFGAQPQQPFGPQQQAYGMPPQSVQQYPQSMSPAKKKSKVTAGILGILLGGFGAHYFYLGKPGWGILYLVLCWTYIPGICGLIEGIMMLTQSDEEFNIKPKTFFK